jgi:periplasmic divalent cation tolerance protein
VHPPAPPLLVVLTTLPDVDTARRVARSLVEQRLAACVNVLAPCSSIYRWQGAVEDATEVPLLIKTRQDRYDRLEAALRGLHPYELPEIVAIPVTSGLAAYLQWVASESLPDIAGFSMQNDARSND